MYRTAITLLAGAAAIVASGAVLAQGRQGAPPELARSTAQERAAEAFTRLDANGDGKLDTSDREARRKAAFERADTNSDGSLSYAEFAGLRADRPAMGEGRMGRRGMRGGPMGPRGMGRGADGDGDGAITQAEFSAAMLARFDAADADSDGILTAAERRAQRDARRQGRAGRPS